jgi:hypothetical protein
MSSAGEATRGQPEERLGLSPMESEICHLHRAASTRGKNDHPERHQLSQAHPIPFWDGDLPGPMSKKASSGEHSPSGQPVHTSYSHYGGSSKDERLRRPV